MKWYSIWESFIRKSHLQMNRFEKESHNKKQRAHSAQNYDQFDIFSKLYHKNIIQWDEIFWWTIPKWNMISFDILSRKYSILKITRKLKTKNTVFGYKKGSKIISDMFLWSATLKLWVVSFATFDLWPFYQAKTWKT